MAPYGDPVVAYRSDDNPNVIYVSDKTSSPVFAAVRRDDGKWHRVKGMTIGHLEEHFRGITDLGTVAELVKAARAALTD